MNVAGFHHYRENLNLLLMMVDRGSFDFDEDERVEYDLPSKRNNLHCHERLQTFRHLLHPIVLNLNYHLALMLMANEDLAVVYVVTKIGDVGLREDGDHTVPVNHSPLPSLVPLATPTFEACR